MQQQLVSCLISVYNGEKHIREAVASLLNQTHKDLEIIVVDDGSTDQTWQALQEIAAEDVRVRIFAPGRLGRGAALNFGLEKCRGEFVAILDGDDIALPERIEKQLKFLHEHPDHGLVGTQFSLVDRDTGAEKKILYPTDNGTLRLALTENQCFAHTSVMFRKKVLRKINGYNPKLSFLFDRDIFIRTARVSKVANLSEYLAIQYHHGNRFFYYKFSNRKRELYHNWMRLRAIWSFDRSMVKLAKPVIGSLAALLPYQLRLAVPKGLRKTARALVYPERVAKMNEELRAK